MDAPHQAYGASRVFAIVPAAGRSVRMGSAKQLLDVGGRTMLAAALEPLLDSAAAGVLAVTRKEIAAGLIEDFRARGAQAAARLAVAFNEHPEAGMIDSVRIGIAEWERRAQPGPRDGYLVAPGDLPGLPPEIVARCIAAFAENPGRIAVAAHREAAGEAKTGHPLIFPQPLAQYVRSAACDKGLNALKGDFARLLTLVETADPAVLRNINTPGDLRGIS